MKALNMLKSCQSYRINIASFIDHLVENRGCFKFLIISSVYYKPSCLYRSIGITDSV